MKEIINIDIDEDLNMVDVTIRVPHFQNFADAVREGKPLIQPIEEGQISTMLCHLGNIAYRTDGAVKVDPATGNLAEGEAGQELWAREKYRDTWADM
mgnify:CR=1 FL=1